MCLPVGALGLFSIGSTILGSVFQFAQQRAQAKAVEQQAAYQAAILRNNQLIAEQAAQDAERRGQLAAQQKRLETGQLIGTQQAVLASNGVVINQGSALSITSDTARFGELDALTIVNNAQREAFGLRAKAVNFGADASLVQASGQNQARAARSSAFGTLLTGAGTVANKWYNFGREGIEPFASSFSY